MGGGTLNANR
jgi:hypothetical protein